MKRKTYLYMIFSLMIFLLPYQANGVELITNGGFETGNFSGWTTVNVPASASPYYRPWAVSPSGAGGGFSPIPTATSVQQGTYNAWNGVVTGGTGQEFYLYQDITIPTGFNVRMTWNDRYQVNYSVCGSACGTTTYTVQILTTGNVLRQTLYVVSTLPGTNTNTGYVNHIANLTAYGGQTIRIRFRTTSTLAYQGPGQLEVDAVSVQTLLPTAAEVSVGGRVLTAEGSGISRAQITLTDGAGNTRTTLSSSFGYYKFDDLAAGEIYTVSVSSKRYEFPENTRVLTAQDNIADLDFIANP